ncbi:hypothetical protein Poly24_08940 [Rosistilla carotiformis]|uniref:Uncharacterized protein n=1 Tax=Rosistilla carotiformis TaxID=2528017 RepID=A0A518JNT1_9BACT|nr:hypothetical protein [Rosistilla carotiformis]QDV67202.1 hypothetical protein Poly24_08940 [Rosistilla carotiformis]
MRPRTVVYRPRKIYTTDDVTIVTTHFNPVGFRRARETYYEWLPTLGNLASQMVCYEAVLDGDAPEIDGSVRVYGTRAKHFMWQKESLLQIALERCRTRLFCWMDHDIYYHYDRWLADGVALLSPAVHAVQLFDQFIRYDRNGVDTSFGGTVSGGYCPGGVWVGEVDWLRSIGGFPHHKIIGSGDDELYARMKGYCSHLPKPAHHIWHGDRGNRKYVERHKMLADLGFDDQRDIRVGASGLTEWCTEKPALHAGVRDYFEGRREDG